MPKYSTLQFIIDLKTEISKIFKCNIIDEIFSQILNQKKSHIKWLKEESRRRVNYLLTEEILNNWIQSLKSKGHYTNEIKNIIDKYSSSNNLPLRRNMYSIKNNPNLKVNYFNTIDNKEKAYWLGWLYAEGNIYRRKDGHLEFSVEIDVIDGVLMKRFVNTIQISPSKVKYYKRYKQNTKGEKIVLRTFRLRFKNREFISDLRQIGFFVGNKSGKIRFPRFSSIEYNLAFLLGFFDGDGNIFISDIGAITTSLSSKSEYFLEDVKSIFGLDYKIIKLKHKRQDKTDSINYSIHLNGRLFNEMMDNYSLSLPRKRYYYPQVYIESQEYNIHRGGKFKFSKDDLKDLILNYNSEQIAEMHKERFGISINEATVRYHCKKWILIDK